MSTSVKLTLAENVTLINLTGAPADMCFFASLFDALSEKAVNVDMISQNPPQGPYSALSFTIADADLRGALGVISEMREIYPEVRTSVSSENAKILVSAREMRESPGFAAKVFQAVALCGADVRMVTTSEIDISLLVTDADAPTVLENLRKGFGEQ